ncbi:MAG TPA: wax ester/triacylglycerol synthase domain-containing protein, partial [Solimonas sp.]|nr:wax ester/triacylglycerol synthase domain-containing protein [Solimonas sp.]
MSAVDHAWLEMDEPNNPMIVSAVLELEDVRAPKRLIGVLLDRLLHHPRFRQRADTTHLPAAWVDDGELHLGYHLRLDRRAHLADDERLAALIGEELAHPLDRALPLWRITLYPRGHHRLAVLFRAHHAIADGVAQLRLLLQLTDEGARKLHTREVPTPEKHHGPLGPMVDFLEAANLGLERFNVGVREQLRHPRRLIRQARTGLDLARAAGRVLLAAREAPECFSRPLSGRRQVAWLRDISLDRVRHFAQAQQVTINDVFLAALGGAFGQVLRADGLKLSVDVDISVSIPVNLRRDDADVVGNSFGLVLCKLPVGETFWPRRLASVSRRMLALKHSPEARAVLAGLEAVGHLPPAAEKRIVNWLGDKACAVVSNLPGPARALHLDGARLADVVFWPPQTSHIGIGIGLLSYAGTLSLGVSADTAQLPRPQDLAA